MTPSLASLVAHATVEERRVSAGRARIAAYVAGPDDGPHEPLIFLHAGVCDARMWAAAFGSFAATRRVVAYDRRGFGDSEPVDEAHDELADLAAVLDAAAVERAVLVGCSQGGRIALDWTLAEPARVARLVLVAAAIGGAPDQPEADPRIEAFIAEYERVESEGDADALNRFEARAWLDGPLSPEGRVSGAPRDLFLAMNAIALGAPQVGQAVTRADGWDGLSRVKVPATVMWGTRDFPHVIDRMRHAAATIPGASTHVFDEVAHLPSLEAPAAFHRALRACL